MKHMRAVAAGRLARISVAAYLLLSLPGCYYMQAAKGQLEIMHKREPIEAVIGAAGTPDELADRLRLVTEARQYSVDELGLPDNDSYRSFADLDRDYVLWSVVAVPELSMDPKTWCYPIVGCVSYRGYFAEKAARRLGDKLRNEGYDVLIGGVAAYSTLGRFSDPILNTMMHWEDVDLVAVMFHELAHQLVYIKGDTGFNESFATAVEEFGIERWLSARGEATEIDSYNERRALQRRLMELVRVARDDLETLFRSDIDDAVKRQQKRERLKSLANAAAREFEATGRETPGWWLDDLNNARLVSLSLYNGLLPAFRVLLSTCADDLGCFYTRVESLAKLDKEARDAQLDAL